MLEWIRTRSRRDLILSLVVAGGFALVLGTVVLAVARSVGEEVSYAHSHATGGGLAYERAFQLADGGRLEIQVADVDVEVAATTGSEARVLLELDDDRFGAEEALERLGFHVDASDGILRIRTEERNRWGFHGDDLDARLRVTVPARFDVSVWTGDGDVAIESFEGEVNLQTGDGDIAVGRVSGPALRIQTGDGDIAVDRAESEEILIQTGDGDVLVGSVTTGAMQVRTGDGDILLQRLRGPLRASTGDGDVRVVIDRFDGLEIRTGDGDVTVEAGRELAADVEMSGGEVFLGDAFALPAFIDGRGIRGQLNGGGPRLSVRVGDGTIRLIEH